MVKRLCNVLYSGEGLSLFLVVFGLVCLPKHGAEVLLYALPLAACLILGPWAYRLNRDRWQARMLWLKVAGLPPKEAAAIVSGTMNKETRMKIEVTRTDLEFVFSDVMRKLRFGEGYKPHNTAVCSDGTGICISSTLVRWAWNSGDMAGIEAWMREEPKVRVDILANEVTEHDLQYIFGDDTEWVILDDATDKKPHTYPGLSEKQTAEMLSRPPRCGACPMCLLVENMKCDFMPREGVSTDTLVEMWNRLLYHAKCTGA